MEMHQIKYFLGVARTLNFTRAAEECNVTQPALTRAVKLLEEELGGELFRRERNLSHLTDLGQRMLPLLQQCYETAQGAKELAGTIRRGEIATLKLALSSAVDISLLLPFLKELVRTMNGLELKFIRGTATEIAERMKQGHADLAISGPIGTSWERFDALPLFTEGFVLACRSDHPLAGKSEVGLAELGQERLLIRTYCELAGELAAIMRTERVVAAQTHDVSSERDLIALLEAGLGVAIVPQSMSLPADKLRRIKLWDVPLQRSVFLYSVAGRPRPMAASALMRHLQATDWETSLENEYQPS
jgi:DNA-binding transcriptional LysR family regulator